MHTTELFRHLQPIADVTLLSYRRQYPMSLYPGASDRDPDQAYLDDVRYELDSLNPWTWIKAGMEARSYDALVLPRWTLFFTLHYLLLVLLRFGSGNRLIFLCHNVVDHDANLIARILAGLVLRRAGRFIVQTEEEKDRLRKVLGREAEIGTIAHPAIDRFELEDVTRESARAHLGVSPDETVILFFGFIRPYKGLNRLLEAFASIAGSEENLRLLVAGESWLKDYSIEASAKRLGIEDKTVFLLKYLSDLEVAQCLKASDFAVLPYLAGSGSGALQAVLGVGLPVIATRLDTFAEVETRGYGVLVPADDVDALADAITTFIKRETRQPYAARVAADRANPSGWSDLAETIIDLSTDQNLRDPDLSSMNLSARVRIGVPCPKTGDS